MKLPEGWITHDGGPCPVDPDSWPDVMWDDGLMTPFTNRFGQEPHRYPARAWTWDGPAQSGRSIIAYKPETPHAN